MRVYVYPMDLGGCGYYRLIWPAKVLQSQGYDVRLVHPNTQRKISGGTDDSGRLVSINIPNDADVMVFQRLTSKFIIDGIDIMRQNGIAVVMDLDDDVCAINPNNVAFNVLHPGRGPAEYNWANTRRAAQKVTMMTVSTPE